MRRDEWNMSSNKRLGKGLEDISHLFLSGGSASSMGPVPPPTETSPRPPESRIRVWLSLSLVPQLPSAFFSANLGVELARAGRRVLAIETAALPSTEEVLGTVQIQPSLNELLEQPEKQLTVDGPMGMKILGFQLRFDELQEFAAEEQEILSQVLRKEEENAEMIWVHSDYLENDVLQRWVRLVQGVVLTVDLNSTSLIRSYQACKFLYHTRPDLRLGLVVFGKEDNEAAMESIKKLTEAASRFLGKSIEGYGTIPEDSLVERSLAARVPVTILAPTSRTASGFAGVARNLLQADQGRPESTDSFYSFFDRLHRAG
jgi:MinD-like ATPase involved in chromosome partitioning or flagellar assembly